MASFSATAIAIFTRYSTYIGSAGLFALLIALGVYMYNNHFVPAAKRRTTEDVSNNPNGRDTSVNGPFATITFFHVDWCKFCTKAQPEWDRFSASMNGKSINGQIIQCVDINLTDENAEGGADPAVKQKYKLTEYPTIQLDKGGKIIVYDASISEKNLHDFVNKMV